MSICVLVKFQPECSATASTVSAVQFNMIKQIFLSAGGYGKYVGIWILLDLLKVIKIMMHAADARMRIATIQILNSIEKFCQNLTYEGYYLYL